MAGATPGGERIEVGATRTFLMTDIESSTDRWAADPEQMAVALAAHDAAVVAVVDAAGGDVFKHTGDGICAVFGGAGSALAAATDIQRQVELPVRIGLHSGEAEQRDGDFFGIALSRCARVMDAGHGGQILLSAAAAALLEDAALVDLGEHHLKGLTAPERIFQAGPGQFPPLRAASRASALPVRRSSLVGRGALVDAVVAALERCRLVTLVGVGGVGKTRVALTAAARVEGDVDRAAFVDLAVCVDGSEVLATVARSLELRVHTWDALTTALSDRSTLLLLDNCEHVLEDVAGLVEDLLDASPATSVLATSREGLAVDGEQLVTVPGLASDGPDAAGVELFVDRAGQSTSDLVLGDADREVVAEICRRLDGIPLAIELAAARASVLSLGELLERLDERFQVLTGGRRRRSRDRQRTLRETVDWSFELLDVDEQEVFARLGTFAGSFDLRGAAAVCERSELEALDLLEALVDKSLLVVAEHDGGRRYRYLETIRTYAEEELQRRGEAAATADRLHSHVVALLQSLFTEPDIPTWMVEELANVRRAHDHALAEGDVERICALLRPLLDVITFVPWPSGLAVEALALPGAQDGECAVVLRRSLLMDAWVGGRFPEMPALASAALDAADDLPGDDGRLLAQLAFVHHLAGDDGGAGEHYAGAVAAVRDAPEPLPTYTMLSQGFWRYAARNPRQAAPTDTDALVRRGLEHGSWPTRVMAHAVRARQAEAAGDYDTMIRAARIVADTCLPSTINWFWALQTQALGELKLHRLDEAMQLADRDLELAHRCGDRSAMVIPTALFALVMQAIDEPQAAGTIRGGLPRRLTSLYVDELEELDRWLAERLDPEQREALFLAGRATAVSDLQALAHGVFRARADR